MREMNQFSWQLSLLRKSVKKKQKLRLILDSLAEAPERSALELGTSQGLLGYFFRQKKGFWVNADEDLANLREAKSLLGSNLVQVVGTKLPFRHEAFDLIVCPDYLEHVEEDELCLQEIARTLKPGGEVIIVTPHTGPGLFLYRLRRLVGLRPEVYGHKRDGYNWRELEERLRKVHLEPERHEIISRLFSEGLELLINLIYVRLLSGRRQTRLRDGHIRPMSRQEFQAKRFWLSLYSLIYPIFWIISQLDKLISFSPGYLVIVWAKKPVARNQALLPR